MNANSKPHRKGPLRKIVSLTSYGLGDMFGHNTGWLDCGHHNDRIFGSEKAVCEKCRLGLPKDEPGDDGWPKSPNAELKHGANNP